MVTTLATSMSVHGAACASTTQVCDLGRHLVGAQAGQLDPGAMSQARQVGNQGTAALVVGVPCSRGENQHQLLITQGSCEEVEQVATGLVDPVDVLHHHHGAAR